MLAGEWSTFTKVRLMCPATDDVTIYFDELRKRNGAKTDCRRLQKHDPSNILHQLSSICRNMYSYSHLLYFIIIIIRQPLCSVVGRRPQHAVSKLPCLVLSFAISCPSSICPGRLSTAWLVSLVVFSCHMVSKW